MTTLLAVVAVLALVPESKAPGRAAFGLPELIRGVAVADYYGTASYASINGVLGFFVTMARAAGPAVAGVAVTAFGGDTLVLVAAGLASLVSAAGLLVFYRRKGWLGDGAGVDKDPKDPPSRR